jgi:hypothetical protein
MTSTRLLNKTLVDAAKSALPAFQAFGRAVLMPQPTLYYFQKGDIVLTDTLIGALLSQLDSGKVDAILPALRAFKALAEALPGIRQPEVIAAINRLCKHDHEAIRAAARAARLLMWTPEEGETVRYYTYSAKVQQLLTGDQVIAEIDDGHRIIVDDLFIWEIEPGRKRR